MKNATIRDIAREAGVSLGTVSKYLNGRTDMRPENVSAIREAIERLDYSVNMVARTLAHKPMVLGVMLSSAFAEYFDPLEEGIRNAVQGLQDHKVSAVYERYADFYDDKKITEVLDRYIEMGVNGVILAPSRSGEQGDIMQRLKEARIPVVAVVSDVEPSLRTAYVGVDEDLSGRIACDLALLTLPKGDRAAIFIGSRRLSEHRLKAESFLKGCEEQGISVCGVYETLDDPDTAYALAKKLLSAQRDLSVIYVATGNSEAVCRAVQGSRVRVIATDTPHAVAPYVADGTVIGALGQHLHAQGETAVQVLYRYLTEGGAEKSEIKLAPELLSRSAILNKWSRNE